MTDAPAKTAAEDALDEIAALCGCPQWEYPGQVVRDVKKLVAETQRSRRHPKWCDRCGVQLNYARSGMAGHNGHTAYDCDHEGCDVVTCMNCMETHDALPHASAEAPTLTPEFIDQVLADAPRVIAEVEGRHTFTPHTWVTELVDGGPAGADDFWICSVCGASGGAVIDPNVEAALDKMFPTKSRAASLDRRNRPFLAGPALKLNIDCKLAARQIADWRAKNEDRSP